MHRLTVTQAYRSRM